MHSKDADKILVIDDDPDTRASLRNILELDGYQVETVATAGQALDRLRSSEFLAILLDRRLPDYSSEALLPLIKQLIPSAEVVIFTRHADLEAAVTAIRLGATDFLLKPVEADLLRATLRRIGRLKNAERLAKQAERLAALGQMAAVLGHEGRNALQRMQANLAMLTHRVPDRPEALDLIARARKAGNQLTRLCEDLLCFAGTITLARETVDLRGIWQIAWSDLDAVREGRSAELVEEAPGAELHYDGDRFRLGQVFRNLFENALAACADPVRVEVRCSEVAHAGQSAFRLAVRDNGPGLTPEQRRKVFEPFYTTKPRGTGLGLAISKRIVEAHGGEMTVGDCKGGAEFVLVLPGIMLEKSLAHGTERQLKEDAA